MNQAGAGSRRPVIGGELDGTVIERLYEGVYYVDTSASLSHDRGPQAPAGPGPGAGAGAAGTRQDRAAAGGAVSRRP